MKTFVRIGSLVFVLGAAGLLAGCASHHTVSQRPRPTNDFEVVETSSKRTLNAQEMTYLRARVAEYLEKEGETGSGDYYVKILLAPEKEGVASEWVVVRFTRNIGTNTDLQFSLLASYPAYYPSYASYDYYPYGYGSYGRLSLQYYDYPYYYGSYYPYFPPSHKHHGKHDHDGKHDGKHDGGKDHDRDDDHPPTAADRPRFKPIPAVGSEPVTRTRRDRDTTTTERSSQHRGENNFPRHGGTPRQSEPRPQPATFSPPRSESPQSAAAPRNVSAQRTESSSSRTESTSRSSSNSARSFSPPAPRTESTPSQSQKEANRADAQRQRLE